MDAPPSLHPTDETLADYGLGKLDDASAEAVHAHLERCPSCRQRAAAMPQDSFLGLFRAGRPTVDSVVSNLGGPVPTQSYAGPGAPPPDSLPSGLADHKDYRVVRELGRGGMGVVYLAENTLMGRREVLKVVGSHLVERPGVLDRFLREIRSAAKLHHPNIVAAYAAMRLGEGVVLAMEYVEGEDLSKLVKSRGPLPVINACYFVYQAALGLQHAHERGMVHRDIKPANLILALEGKKAIVKVLDFGLAKATSENAPDAGLTHEGQMLGTPDYMAPEQIVDAQRADIRADIYSLGCTLYFLLSGGAPFRAASLYELLQAHHSMDAMPLNLARPEVPSELAALVAKMMAKDPSRRFQTPGEVAQALAKFFKPTARPPATPGSGEPPPADPPAPATVAATTQAATPVQIPPLPGRPKPSPEGVAWESLIEFKETDPALLSIHPKPEPAASIDGPSRNWWPIIAAASAAGAVALGIIITIYSGKTEAEIKPTDEKSPVNFVDTGDHSKKIAEVAVGPGAVAGRDATAAAPTGAVLAGPAPEVRAGTWEIEGEELVQSALVPNAVLVFGDPAWSHYDFKFRARATGGTSGFKAVFHDRGPGNGYGFFPGNYYNKGTDVFFEIGGRWGRQDGMTKPVGIAFNRWYDVRVEVRGAEFRCLLDGELMFQGRYDPFSSGRIGLGTWESTAQFRDIEVTAPDGKVLWRGLPIPLGGQQAAPEDVVREVGKPDEGFRPLFNGKDLLGWKADHGDGSVWKAEGGNIVARATGDFNQQSFLLTNENFSDFVLRFEVDLPRDSDSGVVLWGQLGEEPTPVEVNLRNVVPTTTETGSLRYTKAGGKADYLPPHHHAELRPDGQWNEVEVESLGKVLRVSVNGREIVLRDLRNLPARPDVLPALARTSGRLGFQAHTGTVRFRNIAIEDLGGAEPAPAGPAPRETTDPAKFAAVLEEFAPGLRLSTAAVGHKGLAILEEYRGRRNVLRSHPVSQTIPCVLSADVAVPAGKKTDLLLDVSYYAKACDWRLVVKADGRTLHQSTIGPRTTKDGWAMLDIDLSEFAGRTVRLELLNQDTNWHFEFAYWGRIAIVSSVAGVPDSFQPRTVWKGFHHFTSGGNEKDWNVVLHVLERRGTTFLALVEFPNSRRKVRGTIVGQNIAWSHNDVEVLNKGGNPGRDYAGTIQGEVMHAGYRTQAQNGKPLSGFIHLIKQ